MTDTLNLEWERWQSAWRGEPLAPPEAAAPAASTAIGMLAAPAPAAGAATAPAGVSAPLAAGAATGSTAATERPPAGAATAPAGASAPLAAGAATRSPVERMRRRLVRARRIAWLLTAGDVAASAVFVGIGVYALVVSRALPVVVWAISLFVFTAVALGFAIWNRRDALLFSAESTTDFVAALQLRLARRERVPRFLMGFLAAEIAVGTTIHAVWYPSALGRAARLYAISLLIVTVWRWRYRDRLRRERARLDALSREPAALIIEPGGA